MQIHEDSKVQHTSSHGLQRPTCDSCFRATGFADYSATEKAGTLKADGGDGGQRELDSCLCSPYQKKVGALQATDYKGVRNQMVYEGKLILCKKPTL